MAGSEERETADVLWEAYRNGGRGERIRDEIVEHYFALVRPMAAGMLRRLPRGADAHAIESAAAEGLIEAVERFDPGRKRDFAGYARLVMRCRVKDAVRRMAREQKAEGDSSVRGGRKTSELRAIAVVQLSFSGKFRQREIAKLLGISEARVSQILRKAMEGLQAERIEG